MGDLAESPTTTKPRVIVVHNTVENNTAKGIEVDAGSIGLASANTPEVRVAHNTVCNNTDTAILGEEVFPVMPFSLPNTGDRERADREDLQEYGHDSDGGKWDAGEYSYRDAV